MARDFSEIERLVEEKKKRQFQIPSANPVDYSKVDQNTIKIYESIPEYNALERLLDSGKKQQYDLKQKLVNAYTQAQNREAQRFVQNNNISDSILENAFGTNSGKGMGMGVSWSNPQSEQSKKDKEYLSSLPGADMEQLRKYYENSIQQKATEAQKEFAAAHPILGTISTIGTKNVGGLLGTLEGAGAYLTGQPISTDGGSLGKLKDLNEVRQVASDTLKNNADTEFGKKATEMLYGVGTSIADMGMGLALTPTSPLISLSANAAADSMIDTTDRGLSPNQIMGTSLISGAAEAFFEKISLKGIKEIFNNGVSKEAGKTLFKTLLRQMARESGEEMGTEAVNTIADRIINQDLSIYVQSVEAYQNLGMSEEMAKKQAWKDIGENIIYSGIAGALSGGILGGGSVALNGMMNRGKSVTQTTEAELQNVKNHQTYLEALDPLNALGLRDSPDSNVLQMKDNVNGGANGNFVPSSYVNGNGIDSYDSHTAANLTSSKGVTSNNMEYSDFVRAALQDKNLKQTYYFGKISDELADDIYASTGLELDGFNITVPSDNINHSLKEHSDVAKEESKGQIALNEELLSKLPQVYNKPDSIKLSDHKDVRGRDVITFEKRINGIIVVANAISNGRNRLALDTMYIKNSHPTRPDANSPRALRPERSVGKADTESNHVPNALDNSSPLANVQNVHEDNSVNNSVPNPSENVNNTNGNQRVRSYNTTLIEKTDAPQELKNEFIENPDIYTQLSNAETLARAVSILENNDINTAINEYHRMLEQKNPASVPLGYNISKQLAKDGKLDESVQIVREMSKALTESGQFSQAAAITMLNNDPEAAKRYLIREIDVMNTKGKEKFGKKWKDFELTEGELLRFNDIQQGDTEAISKLYNDVYNRLRREYPSTITEKLMEFRRISMLLNVRTNMRNIVSNALMRPVRWTADRVSALGEGVYGLINPKYNRTQSINPIRSQQSRELASQAFENVRAELLGTNKYEDVKGATRDKQVFKGNQKVWTMMDNLLNGALSMANKVLNTNFDTESGKVSGLNKSLNAKMGKDVNPSLLETARNFTYFLLQKGDDVFVKKNFESRMASYLQAQGITDLENIPADAYVLASQEALKATFKDDTKLSNTLSNMRRNFGIVGDIIMPFTKTPANLAMRGIDYSPLGVINGVKTLKNAQNQADVTKGITQLGQAATGTAAILLGYALAEAGWIIGALSDDKDEAQFQKQQGQLAYSVKTPWGYLSYDWAQPAVIPLILGATIHDCATDSDNYINAIKNGFLAAADSWMELSPLQNLSDIFGGYGTPSENVADVLMNDFPLSFVPSQLGAIAKTGDTTQRVTYTPNSWDSFVNQAKAKIPGMSDDLPISYDTWGKPIQRQDSTGEAFFANFLNPGQFGNENVTPIDDEISALYDATGNASVFPKKASWSYNIGGESVKLDNEQYSKFQRIMGSNAYDMADSLINSNYYSKLSDEQKTEVIKNMYSFADALAKSKVLGYDVENSDTYKKTYAVYSEKGAKGVALYTSIKETLDGNSNAAKVNAVSQFNISDEDKGYYLSKMINLSKEAQEAYNANGYAGVYNYYYEKAMTKDNWVKYWQKKFEGYSSKKTADSWLEQFKAYEAEKNGTNVASSDTNNDAVAAMRNKQTTQITPEMVAAVAAMRANKK